MATIDKKYSKRSKNVKRLQSKGKSRSKPFPIVAIGASAGGLEAISELLRNLSSDTGMAYVYIQHLDPTHESMLSTILSKFTRMKVQEAKEKMPILPDHVYIIPPNKDMIIVDGVLKLNPRPQKPAIHFPVNSFFMSLAEKQREGAIAIVLSGNASDGAEGLKAVKTAGGLTFAQDDTAKFQSMPKSAVAMGAVDLVLSPKDIAGELERLSEHTSIMRTVMADEEDRPIEGVEDLNGILQLLKKSSGADFSHYKKNTIQRRVVRRMLLHKQPTLKKYHQYLKQHADEVQVLYQDLLINVTSFFRDPATTDFLKKVLLPKIIKSKPSYEPIRIWIPACSTGEEAYSMAIILAELLGERPARPIQIFATDLSEMSITKARLGIYTKHDLAGVSPKRIQRFFASVDGGYRVVKFIRDICIFAPHNVFQDPPFSRLDLISCCNLLIYLDSVLQKKVLATFHYGLRPKGYLVLGKSETIGTSGNLFTALSKKMKIYQCRKDSNARAVFEMNYRVPEPEKYYPVKTQSQPYPHPHPRPKEALKDAGGSTGLEKLVDSVLLTRYMPASVVVTEDFEIVHFRGSTGMFLEPAPGRASLNLLKMARSGLGFELRNAVHKVIKSAQPFKKSGLEIKHRNHTYNVSIEVVPLKTDNGEKYFLVIFEEYIVPAVPSASAVSRDKKVKQLENELTASREDMRTLIEEQEAVNEELQSANEEIVSSNEELQSINEEMETSKEEVESTNEELMTINNEMQVRNDQLAESYEYAEAMITTIREAVVVLDVDLRVKTANKSFYNTFGLKEEETDGRLIYELGNNAWNVEGLHELLEKRIPQHTYLFGFRLEHVFPGVGEKVMMLNARRIIQKTHRQELIILAIEDITEHAVAQRIIAGREAMFRNMADHAPVMIWTTGQGGNPTFFNKTWLEFTGRRSEQEMGGAWAEAIHPDDRDGFLKSYHSSFATQQPYRLEHRLKRHDGNYRWVLLLAKPEFAEGKFTGYIGTVTDIQDQRMVNEELEKRVKQRTNALQEANRNLEASNSELEQFAYVASHDLQEPLRKIITYSDMLSSEAEKDLPDKAKGYLHKIFVSSQRMQQLIEDLLNISRVDISKEKFAAVDLNLAFRDVLLDFEDVIANKKAEVRKGGLPVVEAVPAQMKQLFYNLLSNALKFTSPDRKPLVQVSSRMLSPKEVEKNSRLDKSKSYCEIVFNDNGIGFNPAFSEQIFTIFQRLHTKDKFPGTGIGLALCRKIVTNHGGEIFASGVEKQGASFHIILPVNASRA